MRSLVPLSGGVDSVYVLAKLLRETDDEVIALHIRMGNSEGRWGAEDRATQAVVAYCQKHFRHFEFIETTVDRRRLASFGLDVMTVAFQVGLVHHHYLSKYKQQIDRYLFGYCAEELADEQSRPEQEDRVARLRRLRGIGSGDINLPQFDTLDIVSKAEELFYLGPELANLCWTCREPKAQGTKMFRECGACKTCRIMRKARVKVAELQGIEH